MVPSAISNAEASTIFNPVPMPRTLESMQEEPEDVMMVESPTSKVVAPRPSSESCFIRPSKVEA